jgi:hypothetical protein
VNSEESEQSEAYSALLARRIGGVALAGPGGKRDSDGVSGPDITMVTIVTPIKANIKLY